ncbi:MAG: DUF2911 domain-containing protein [Pyrinomonadaceae bacterium]
MKKTILTALFVLISSVAASAQLNLPRESQRQEITQIVGDTKISIVYHRPNVKGREIWGCQTNDFLPKGGATYPCLVPYGQVWRTGANDNTTFEVSNDVTVNGQKLPAGKYGLHTIPGPNEWTIIFNKVNNEWGSFKYDQKQDQLRVTAKPQPAPMRETMSINFDAVTPTATEMVIAWEKIRVPLTIDVGDVKARVLTYLRGQMNLVKPDDFSSPVTAANYIYSQKMTENYAEAVGWLDALLKRRETVNALALKANLLADSGNKAEAIAAAERALELAKTMNPKPNTEALEKRLAEWKTRM